MLLAFPLGHGGGIYDQDMMLHKGLGHAAGMLPNGLGHAAGILHEGLVHGDGD
jgi:hypothetical protein